MSQKIPCECLYVARGTNRVLKVGRTKFPQNRIQSLRPAFRLLGADLQEYKFFTMIPRIAANAEASLIAQVRRQCSLIHGREWFLEQERVAAEEWAEQITQAYRAKCSRRTLDALDRQAALELLARKKIQEKIEEGMLIEAQRKAEAFLRDKYGPRKRPHRIFNHIADVLGATPA